MSHLHCLCLFVCDGIRNVLCCVFLRIVCHVLLVSLECPFLIDTSVKRLFLVEWR